MSHVDTEWGIRWGGDDEIEPCASLQEAERLVDMYPSWAGEIVGRNLKVGDWWPL